MLVFDRKASRRAGVVIGGGSILRYRTVDLWFCFMYVMLAS
jgi:hypothetical protein